MYRCVKWLFHITICIGFMENIVGQLPTKAPRMNIQKLDWNIYCKFQPNNYDCFGNGTSIPSFYFDSVLGACKTFDYGGCVYSFNTFHTLFHCSEKCLADGPDKNMTTNLTNNIICRLQPEFGNCFGYHPMFYYDVSERQCRGFSYSGCGGNNNRFPSTQLCTVICAGQVEYDAFIRSENGEPESMLI